MSPSKVIDSPVGPLTLVASAKGLAEIRFGRDAAASDGDLGDRDGEHPLLAEAERQLGDYFAGGRRTFDLPLDFVGTPFQQQVWQALLDIPYGETRSYADVARAIGRPTATRAVGAANGRNPIPIIAPCHRVIGSDGSLTGFGGGLDAKRRLLGLEGGLLI